MPFLKKSLKIDPPQAHFARVTLPRPEVLPFQARLTILKTVSDSTTLDSPQGRLLAAELGRGFEIEASLTSNGVYLRLRRCKGVRTSNLEDSGGPCNARRRHPFSGEFTWISRHSGVDNSAHRLLNFFYASEFSLDDDQKVSDLLLGRFGG